MHQVVLIGDSDIAYWPKDLLPWQVGSMNHEPLVSGYPGATLAGVLPHARRVMIRTMTSVTKNDTLFVVACAGENDIGEGLSLEKSVGALKEFLNRILMYRSVLIFLGPKFEPWLEDEKSYKIKYEAMTRAFEKCLKDCQKDHPLQTIHFVDCLTMFCGETANLPGARLGGRAKADPRYFKSDKLHLSKEGYAVWSQIVTDIIQKELQK
mmetsp:Transcript_6737/g.16445  ORF Transcript_6737/g.16445 Transcript_6737/m.16445 type:complete len:209 (+) Transcript_6737:123-749(+)